MKRKSLSKSRSSSKQSIKVDSVNEEFEKEMKLKKHKEKWNNLFGGRYKLNNLDYSSGDELFSFG